MARLGVVEEELSRARTAGLWLPPSDPARPVTFSDRELFTADGDAPTHVEVVAGDNLDVLAAWSDERSGSVAVIVTDPPYNTGRSTMRYPDSWAAGPGEWSSGRWLAFMEPRLVAARELLRDDGVFWCWIDEREVHGLKLLCDRIFGAANHAGTLHVQVKAAAGFGQGGPVVDVSEYVLGYTKTRAGRRGLVRHEWGPLDLHTCRSYSSRIVMYGSPGSVAVVSAGASPATVTTFPDGQIETVAPGQRNPVAYRDCWRSMFRTTNAQGAARFVPHLPDGLASVTFTPQAGPDRGVEKTWWFWNRRLIVWLSNTVDDAAGDGGLRRRTLRTNLWPGHHHQGLSNEGGVKFPHGKKPVGLYERLLDTHPDSGGVVLDFFAGSGTAAEAAACRNRADGGTRGVWLVNDDSDAITSSVTFPRVKGVVGDVRPDGTRGLGVGGSVSFVDALPGR